MKKCFNIKHPGMLAIAGFVLVSLVGAAMPNGHTKINLDEIDQDLVDEVDAPAVWAGNCASCHGRDGRGQTRIGRRAGAKDYTDHEHQKSFSNERGFASVKKGMVVDGRELMKPFGKGLSEDNGLTDSEILALIHYLRDFDGVEWTDELNQAALEAEKKEAKDER